MNHNGNKVSTRLEVLHRTWLSQILGMQTSGFEGIDLFDDVYAIELKCKLLKKGHQTGIAVPDYQVTVFPTQNSGREMFWAFLYYKLSSSANEATNNKLQTLTERHVYFQPWPFIDQFPPSKARLETWRYVRRRLVLEQPYRTIQVENGILHFPQECSLIPRFNYSNQILQF